MGGFISTAQWTLEKEHLFLFKETGLGVGQGAKENKCYVIWILKDE